ncbi:MAG: cation-translocating P-type ATPase [Thiohalorhabdus sp.]|uniref:cation-translocating P-type ATPase n=1 Tax=Thiohalorhabdus sp. TaxID=3094134 RepID=UPI00397FE578
MDRQSDPAPPHPEAPHALTPHTVPEALGVDPERGLSEEEAERRRRRYGPNRLAERRATPWWRLLWNQLSSLVVLLLIGAGAAGFLVGEVIEATAILLVLVVNTLVGFATEYQASRSMAALRRMIGTIAEVERGDRRDEIDAEGLVPGDMVRVEGGEHVPADLRILEAEDLQAEESALTGESEAVTKGPEPVDRDAPLGDRTSMLFTGTTVVGGWARGVVVATGPRTEMGRVADLAGSIERGKAPLQEGLDQLSRRLALLVVIGAGVLVGIGLLQGRPLNEVVEVAVALAIAVVPEGLPAVATLTLAVGMRRMAAENALVRRLPAVETLGSTTVVCSDKTGTLTRNEMAVTEVALGRRGDPDLLWRAAVLCNDADVDPDGNPVGDPTEVALLHGAAEHGLDWRRLREEHEREREAPFSSETKRMAVVIGDRVYIKGAPEVLIDREREPELAETAERMAGRGLRTLAVATRQAPAQPLSDEELFADLKMLGVVGMQDPPRETAVRAVKAMHDAGIRTVMITGDRADTAAAIANQMGLSRGGVAHGRDLARTTDQELAEAVADTDVYARVDPEHKLRLIEALQSTGEVVAVTGDGVNDAPALIQADVGVAMGSGTDVARDAADIILLDDEYGTIEAAVEEGRRIFANIRRFGQFLFSWHVAEVGVITSSIAAGFAPPLTGLMILWNNLVIDVLPSFALALEPSRRDVMRQPPRDPREPVISREVVQRILTQAALVAGVGLTAFGAGAGPLALGTEGAQTMTFVAMSLGQVLAVFNARAERGSGFRGAFRNPWLWGALALTALLETAALGVPALAEVLGLTALPPAGWALAAGLGLLPVGLTQTFRILRS